MKKYVCTVCDWVYDPAVGDPDAGIAPGVAFEDLPDDWVCPVCGVGKEDFTPVKKKKKEGCQILGQPFYNILSSTKIALHTKYVTLFPLCLPFSKRKQSISLYCIATYDFAFNFISQTLLSSYT